jgi:putative IMPACT (imprinted ancient) family translation regulator
LREVEMGRRIERVCLTVTVPYAAVDPLRRGLPSWDAVIESEKFGEAATLVLVLPRSREQRFRQELRDLTAGRVRFEE